MFLAIKYIKTVADYKCQFKLIDSDFETLLNIHSMWNGFASIVIEEYSKRKLNVAANLVRFFQWYEKEYGSTIARQLSWTENQSSFTPEFTSKIKADIQKYLALL